MAVCSEEKLRFVQTSIGTSTSTATLLCSAVNLCIVPRARWVVGILASARLIMGIGGLERELGGGCGCDRNGEVGMGWKEGGCGSGSVGR